MTWLPRWTASKGSWLFGPILGVLFIIGPPYLFEKTTEYFFLTHQPSLFFTFSGTRYDLDVLYIAAAGYVVGRVTGSVARAWLVCLASVAILISLFYQVCEPRLCYNAGVDGLEPLRMGSVLVALGVSTASVGSAAGVKTAWPRRQAIVTGAFTFYAIAYHPVVFSFAGAGILPPLDPFAELAFLGFLSLVVSLKLPEVVSGPWRVTVPLSAMGVLVAVCAGMATHYFQQVLPVLSGGLVAVLAGALVAVPVRKIRVGRLAQKSGWPIVALLLFVVVSTLVVWPDEVAGQVLTSSSREMPDTYSYAIPNYVGGFMSSSMVRTKAVAVNVTFAGTDPASIGQGRFLAAGLGVHSADCCTDGIDYGYRFDLVVFGNASEALTGSAWQTCDANAACGGHSWKTLMYHFSVPFAGSTTSEHVQLVLKWENRSIVYQYSSDSGSGVAGSFDPPAIANAVFNAGWQGPPDQPSPRGAFFFQFGVSNVGGIEGNWLVSLACPSILDQGNWQCVEHAQSLQGDQSFWKVLWRWGESFPRVSASYDSTTRTVSFFGSDTTIGSFVHFW